MIRYPRNLTLLFLSQAIFVSVIIISFTFAGLVGALLASDPKNATLPIAAFSLTTLTCIFPASMLMKRIGRKKGFLCGTLFGMLSGTMAVIAIYMNSFLLFCLSNMLLGVYQAFAQYYRFAAIEFSKNYHSIETAVSIVLSGGVLGTLIGPTLGSFLNQWYALYHYAEVYIATTLLSILGIAICAFIQQPPKELFSAPALKIKHSLRHLLQHKKYHLALINVCVAYFLMVLLMTGTPLSMHKSGFDIMHINFVIQWHLLGMYLPSFFMGKILQRYGLKKGYCFAIILFLFSLFFVWYQSSFFGFSSALIMVGIAWNVMYMSGSIIVGMIDDRNKPVAQATNETCIFLTYSIAAYLAGTLVNSIGWSNISLFCIPFLLISIVSLYCYHASLDNEL